MTPAGIAVALGLIAMVPLTWPYGAGLLILLWWVWRRS